MGAPGPARRLPRAAAAAALAGALLVLSGGCSRNGLGAGAAGGQPGGV